MIPGFPQFGGMELIILLVIILLLFGAKRIPGLARSLGKGTREFRKGIEGDHDDEEARERGEDEKASTKENTRSAEGVARTEQKL